VHALAPAGLYVPAEHAVQAAPDALNVPAAQGVHEMPPEPALHTHMPVVLHVPLPEQVVDARQYLQVG
jgi:hypothetical protein